MGEDSVVGERCGPSLAERADGFSPWLWLLLLGGGALVAFLIWRSRRTPEPTAVSRHESRFGGRSFDAGAGTAAGTPGQPTAGGGWAKPIIGGMAGAMAGNWLSVSKGVTPSMPVPIW